MGARIRTEGRVAVVEGVNSLYGADVLSPDLRGGAALVVAGLCAEGVTTVGNVGHSTVQGAGSRYQTGGLNYNEKTDAMTDYKEYKDVSKNIYDLEGNVRAWTTEACGAYSRVYRGGLFANGFSASSRIYDDPYVSLSTNIGSLAQLYVK
jgi:hypothetical protein